MNFINYIDTVFSDLRRDPYLVVKRSDIFNLIIWCGIKLMNIEWSRWIEWKTRFAFIACFKILTQVTAVYGFGKDPGAGGFPHASWSAEKISVCKMITLNSTFQRICNGILANYHIKTGRPVFPCWNYKVFHKIAVEVLNNSWTQI